MKPPPFEYHRPSSVEAAVELLATLPGAKVLAGGQSLIPLLNFRLAAPSHLVDVSRLHELRCVRVGPDRVEVGAAVTHTQLERHAGAARACPLLREAEGLVAHAVIRNRGTVCGSIAHADPAGELTAVLALLDGAVVARSVRGERTVAAPDLFVGPLETSLAADELVVEASFATTAASVGVGVAEVARRHGDYALAGAAAAVGVDAGGRIHRARVALIAVGPTPVSITLGELVGRAPADLSAADLYDRVAGAVEPDADIHASADYRRHLAGTTAVEAVGTALRRARVPAPAA